MATDRLRKLKHALGLISVLGAIAMALAPAAHSAPAASVDGWTLRPTPEHGQQRDVLQYVVAQNQVIHDSVTLSNPSSKPVSVTLYAADAYNTAQGGAFAFTLPKQKKTGAGTWISIKAGRLTVPARRQANIPITIHVPNRVSPGSVASGVVAQDVKVQQGTSQGDVHVGVRYGLGVRVYLQVVGPTHPGLGVAGVSVDRAGGSTLLGGGHSSVGYTVVNTGNERLDATASAKIVDQFGHTVHTFPKHELQALLPGAKVQLDDPWKTPWAGRFRVDVTVQSDKTTAHGSGVIWVFPLILLLPVLILIGLAAWWWWRRLRKPPSGRRWFRRGPNPDGPDDGGPDDSGPDDDLEGDPEPVDAVAGRNP